MIRRTFQTLTLASLLTLPLATTACSPGQSPTEPAFDDTETSAVSASSTSTVSSVTDESRRGRGGKDDGTTKSDDNKADDKGGRGRGRGNRGGGNDDGQKAPRGGQEFEAAVASVGSGSLTLVNGVRVVVNGTTQWSSRGDLFTLDQVAGSLAAGRHPRVEGRGTRQADG
ncbi:MAG TPA: hypothetical protein VH394_16195, partial [Thermoanaerobaculia bacterium]|nr:hypothetical protein [Thermoanaerobaculia bacterium]